LGGNGVKKKLKQRANIMSGEEQRPKIENYCGSLK
jgi:hypothetical protein